MIIFLYILISIFAIAVVFYTVSYFTVYARMLKGEAPFVPVPAEFLPKIIETLEIKENSIVYDLGCGDGRVLFASHWRQPKANYIGFEKSFAIFLCGWIRSVKLKNRDKVKIFRKDIFQGDISDATHVFTYLMPRMMERLAPKLKRELKPGTRLVSCSFSLKNREPSHVIELKSDKVLAPSMLYVYDF